MKLLVLGDMVGASGVKAVLENVPRLIKKWQIDFTIVNGENAADGFGISKDIFQQTIDAGVDVITSGNHAFDKKETLMWADSQTQFLRPANYPPDTPGKGANIYKAKNGADVLVINIMGQVFMPTGLENPFVTMEKQLAHCLLKQNVDAIIVDFHAETTSEKQCMGHFLDGKISLLFGTHTHIPTADFLVLPKGTAYQTDIGMCGDYNSSIGMDLEEPMRRFTTQIQTQKLQAATGTASLCGCFVLIDDKTGLATSIQPVRIGGRLSETIPKI